MLTNSIIMVTKFHLFQIPLFNSEKNKTLCYLQKFINGLISFISLDTFDSYRYKYYWIDCDLIEWDISPYNKVSFQWDDATSGEECA